MSNRRRPGPTAGTPVVRFKCNFKNIIYDVLNARNWREVEGDEWDIYWTDTGWMREVFPQMKLEDYQRVNHFRNHYELTRKDLLVKNLKRIRKQMEKSDDPSEADKYDFFPATFVLPAEYALFLERFKETPGSVWIMKPIGRAQGKGIFLFNKLSQISDWKKDHRWKADSPQAETYIVQRYLERPYLVGGKKFDLRLYVLVTSYTPLVVYLHRSGFARFSNQRFSMREISNAYVHLTNVAIQKTASEYDSRVGCKWLLRNFKLYLISKHGMAQVNTLFHDMQQIIIRSLLSVQKTMMQDKHCFELYGYDILIDDSLKPWLIEVNASPSLSAENPPDYEMKFALLDDTMEVLDLEHKLKGNEEQVGGFDLIYSGGPIKSQNPRSDYASYLGCYNPRSKQLKAMAKHSYQRQQQAQAAAAAAAAAADPADAQEPTPVPPAKPAGKTGRK